MSTTQKRTLTLTCTEGNDVTKKQLTCFVHNLIADVKKTRPLVVWKRDPKAKAGENAYYTNGLAAGSYITLKDLGDGQGIEMTYSRHGDLVYKALELYGDSDCDMHIASLLKNVATSIRVTEMLQTRSPLAEVMKSLKPKPQPKTYTTTLGDIFRSLDVEELLAAALDQSTMLNVGISQSTSCLERKRREALIRATVSYLQNVQRKDIGLLLTGFSLKSLDEDGKKIGLIVGAPLSRIANAYVAIQEDPYYSRLKPADANLQFAKDIIVHLLIGV